MKYDSSQLEIDLKALTHNKEITMQQYHKICGAIEIVEAMLKNAIEYEQEKADEIISNQASEDKESVVSED